MTAYNQQINEVNIKERNTWHRCDKADEQIIGSAPAKQNMRASFFKSRFIRRWEYAYDGQICHTLQVHPTMKGLLPATSFLSGGDVAYEHFWGVRWN